MKKRMIVITAAACAAAVLGMTGLFSAADGEAESETDMEAVYGEETEAETESVSETATEAEAVYNPVTADNVLIYLPASLRQTSWQILGDGREEYQFTSDANIVNILIDSLEDYTNPEEVAAAVLSTDKANYETAAADGEISILSEADFTIDSHDAYSVIYQAPYTDGQTLTYLTYIIDSGSSIVTIEYFYVEDRGDPLQEQIIQMFNNISVE